MENPIYQTDEGLQKEDPLAGLNPPVDWTPDTDRAWKHLLERRESASRTLKSRLSLTGIVLIAAGSILFILPWYILRSPDSKRSEPVAAISSVGPVSPNPKDPVTVVEVKVSQDPETRLPAPAETKTRPAMQSNSARLVSPDTQQTPPAEAAKPGASPVGAAPPLIAKQKEPQSEGKVTEPIIVSQVQPEYTDEAREARVQGTIELLCLVKPDGTVKVDSIRRGLGYGLDEKAREAVEKWRFIPGTKDGVSVSVFISILVGFSLK
jgi:TonB family protein